MTSNMIVLLDESINIQQNSKISISNKIQEYHSVHVYIVSINKRFIYYFRILTYLMVLKLRSHNNNSHFSIKLILSICHLIHTIKFIMSIGFITSISNPLVPYK